MCFVILESGLHKTADELKAVTKIKRDKFTKFNVSDVVAVDCNGAVHAQRMIKASHLRHNKL